MENETLNLQQPKPAKKMPSKVTLALSIISAVLLLGCGILGYQLYQKNSTNNSQATTSTIGSEQPASTSATTQNVAQTIPSYYKQIKKDGVTFYYPNDWPDPTITSASAKDFVLNVPYGPEVAYQYNAEQKNGEGLWLCTEEASNENVCVPGSATYPQIARKDRTMLADGSYQFNSIFSTTIGDGNNIVYTFTVANNATMVTMTLPTICQESAEFPCADGTVKQTDKTAGIVDDIVAYITRDE